MESGCNCQKKKLEPKNKWFGLSETVGRRIFLPCDVSPESVRRERERDGNRLAVPETGRPVATRDEAEEKQQADGVSRGKVAGINNISHWSLIG